MPNVRWHCTGKAKAKGKEQRTRARSKGVQQQVCVQVMQHANLTLPPTRGTDVPAVNASVPEHAVVLGSQG
jgi:hypothetical protein